MGKGEGGYQAKLVLPIGSCKNVVTGELRQLVLDWRPPTVTETGDRPPLDFPELESGGPGASGDEFAHIPSSRRRHPALALGAALLAAFLTYQIHEDLFFALSHSDPTDLGDARGVASQPLTKLPLNRVVRLAGAADRESGVIIDTAGSWRFVQFFRLLGTKSRIFLSRVPDPIPVEQAERDVFEGRLLRFRDLSFADAIRKHFASRVTATHFFAAAAVRDAVSGSNRGSLSLNDLFGEKVSLAPGDELFIDVARPTDVQVDLPRKKFRDLAAARAAVESHGAGVLDEAPKSGDDKSVSLVITFPPEKRDQCMSEISDLDAHIRYRPLRTTYRATLAELAAGTGAATLRIGVDGKELPLEKILAIRTVADVQIPDDALILREGDRPASHFTTIVVAVFLLGFAVLNLLALRSRG